MNWSYVLEGNVEKFPNKEAIIFGERRLTYKQLGERVDGLARGLQQLGLKRGDIVAILLLNCSEYLEITFAVNKLGGVWTCRGRQPLQQILLVFLLIHPTQPGQKSLAYESPAVPVRDPAMQDTIKEGVPFLLRATGVMAYKLEHGLLHQIKSFIGVAGSKFGHPESPAFNIGQKSAQRIFRIQSQHPANLSFSTDKSAILIY